MNEALTWRNILIDDEVDKGLTWLVNQKEDVSQMGEVIVRKYSSQTTEEEVPGEGLSVRWYMHHLQTLWDECIDKMLPEVVRNFKAWKQYISGR